MKSIKWNAGKFTMEAQINADGEAIVEFSAKDAVDIFRTPLTIKDIQGIRQVLFSIEMELGNLSEKEGKEITNE